MPSSIYKYYSIPSHTHPNFFPLLHNLTLKSMSSPFLLLLLLLSLSSHVCDARHPRNDHKQDVRDLKARDQISIPLKLMESSSSGDHSRQLKPMNAKDGVVDRVGSANTKDPSDSDQALPGDTKGTRGSVSGNKNFVSSSAVCLRQTAKLKETGKRARSLLGSGSGVEEGVESDETNVDEDVVAMDYQQVPHGKPPIHNPLP